MPQLTSPHRFAFLTSIALLLLVGCGKSDDTSSSGNGNGNSKGKGKPEIVRAALEPLIDAKELHSRLKESGLRILDARAPEQYEDPEGGHISGAVFVDVAEWKTQMLDEESRADSDIWAEMVSGLGIEELSNVVVYADKPTDAARIWWTLRFLGVENVAILDGGWNAWKAAEYKVSHDETEVDEVMFQPTFHPERLMLVDDLQKVIKDKSASIVDARSPGEFAGTDGDEPRKGHVPGAVNIEWTELLDEEGRFKSTKDLKKLFADGKVATDKPVVTYCRSGGRAALNAFALELAGYSNVKSYYCGWQEWSATEKAPVAKPE